MREILFRGKRVDNGEWVEGATLTVLYQENTALIFMPQSGEPVKADVMDSNDRILTSIYGNFYQVIPATVGRYTGLTDKNGKMIFEGDIIVINTFEKGKTKKFRVEFDDGIFGIRLSANAYDSTIIPLRSFDYIEIIKGEEND